MATTLIRVGAPSGARSHRYYIAMAIGFVALIAVTFPRTYRLRLAGDEHLVGMGPLTPLATLHGAVFATWFALLIAQVSLIASGRPSWHRRLGLSTAGLVPLMVVVGLVTAVLAARAGWNPGGVSSPQAFLLLSLGDMALFGSFAAAALWYRRRSEIHKRLVMLASVSLLWAAITRLPFSAGIGVPPIPLIVAMVSLLALLALSGPLYDFVTRRRVYPLEVAGGVLIVAMKPIARLVGGTDVWRTLAGWLIGP